MGEGRKASRRRTVWSGRVVGAAVLACAVAAALFQPFPVNEIRLLAFDFLQRATPREAVKGSASPVVVVGIDEKSLAVLGQWPWPRTKLADLAGRLAGMGARVVAFDVLFAEADRRGAPGDDNGDAAFAAAIKDRPIVLGMGVESTGPQRGADPYPGMTVAVDGADGLRALWEWRRLVRNIPDLERNAAGLGVFLLDGDGDGIARRVPTVFRTPAAMVPSFFVEALRVGTGKEGPRVKTGRGGLQTFRFDGGPAVATDAGGHVWPHFGRLENREFLSAADILAGTVGPERVAGRYVLVGATAMGLGDVRFTPLRQAVPGVEIHAQALESVLAGDLLVRPGYMIGAELVSLVVTGLLGILLFPVCRAGLLLPALAGGVAVLAGLSGGLFAGRHLLFDVTLSIATWLALFMMIVALRTLPDR